MAFKISRLKADPQREVEGVWVDVYDGLRLRVARLTNPHFREAVRKQGRKHQLSMRRGLVDDAQLDDITRVAVAKYVLLGWENLVDDNDKPIPYSPEKALEIFKESPDFYDMVIEYANDITLFKDAVAEDAKGNSSTSSNGS